MRVLRFAGFLAAPLALVALVATGASASESLGGSASGGLSYVAMGSSFAAGPGISPAEPGGASGCARSAGNYANLVAEDLGANLTDMSCSGATTANILTDDQDGQSPQIDAVGSGTQLVTVTIGGNDIDYLGSLDTYSCQDTGGSNCGTVDTGAIDSALSGLTQSLENVVTAIRARAPQARVLLVNYFTVLSGSGSCAGVPFTASQAAFEESLAADLAQDTATAAATEGATLVDLAAASELHDSCSAAPWVNTYDVAPGLASYHPNATGMAAAAQLIQQSLAAGGIGSYPVGPITSGISGMCLDDAADSAVNGNKIDIWGCNSTPAQQWQYSNGTLTINGKCLDVLGANSTADGTLVDLWACTGAANQAWKVVNNTLVNPQSGKCLDDPGFSTTPGTQLVIFDCNGGSNQAWTMPPIVESAISGPVISGVDSFCLDDANGSTANGNPVDIADCDSGSGQQWELTAGTLRNNGMCLDVVGSGSTADGTLVDLWGCNGGANQTWDAVNGMLFNPQSGKCLDDPAFSTTPGTQLDIWDCNGGSNQAWTMPSA